MWINKLQYIHSVKYVKAVKINKPEIYIKTRIDLSNKSLNRKKKDIIEE